MKSNAVISITRDWMEIKKNPLNWINIFSEYGAKTLRQTSIKYIYCAKHAQSD